MYSWNLYLWESLFCVGRCLGYFSIVVLKHQGQGGLWMKVYEASWFQRVSPRPSRWWAWQQAGKHDIEAGIESSHLTPETQGKELTGNDEARSQWYSSSKKAIAPNPFQMSPPTGAQASK